MKRCNIGKVAELWPRWWMLQGWGKKHRLASFSVSVIRDFSHICCIPGTDFNFLAVLEPKSLKSIRLGWSSVVGNVTLLLQISLIVSVLGLLLSQQAILPSLTCGPSNLQDQDLQTCLWRGHMAFWFPCQCPYFLFLPLRRIHVIIFLSHLRTQNNLGNPVHGLFTSVKSASLLSDKAKFMSSRNKNQTSSGEFLQLPFAEMGRQKLCNFGRIMNP